MSKVLGAALMGVGVLLLVWGFNASNSLGSDFSRFFHGTPTDRTIGFYVGGAAASLAGAVLLLRPRKKSGK